jgi:hypothetical protein
MGIWRGLKGRERGKHEKDYVGFVGYADVEWVYGKFSSKI